LGGSPLAKSAIKFTSAFWATGVWNTICESRSNDMFRVSMKNPVHITPFQTGASGSGQRSTTYLRRLLFFFFPAVLKQPKKAKHLPFFSSTCFPFTDI